MHERKRVGEREREIEREKERERERVQIPKRNFLQAQKG